MSKMKQQLGTDCSPLPSGGYVQDDLYSLSYHIREDTVPAGTLHIPGMGGLAKHVQGGVKYDAGKPRMELLSPIALQRTADVLTFGARKYEAHNWRKGMDWSRLLGASLRHLTAFMDGENTDPETGLCHLHHLACCVMFLQEYYERGLGTDDRYKGEVSENNS